jgi:uncharacterized Zn-finger protein
MKWGSRAHLLVTALGIGFTIAAVGLLLRADWVVHVLLYNYGLQFDVEWATPYWTFLRLSLGLLGCAVGSSILLIAANLLQFRRGALPEVRKQPQSVATSTQTRLKDAKEKPEEGARIRFGSAKEKKREEDVVEITALPIVCNKCEKVFTQPLCMFDFKSGKPRLVNVCPYCNAILAVSGNSRTQ